MASRFIENRVGLNRLLREPGGEVARDLTKRVIKVESGAKRRCPVDTGRLRSSITHQIGKDGKGLVGIVGSDVEYAPHVELGTRYMGAQPFLRPALSDAR